MTELFEVLLGILGGWWIFAIAGAPTALLMVGLVVFLDDLSKTPPASTGPDLRPRHLARRPTLTDLARPRHLGHPVDLIAGLAPALGQRPVRSAASRVRAGVDARRCSERPPPTRCTGDHAEDSA
jgi:hypothetical protein